MNIFKSAKALLDRFLTKKDAQQIREEEMIPAKDFVERKVDPDLEKKRERFRLYKRTMRGVAGALTWKDFYQGTSRTKQTNRAQIARCEANRVRRLPDMQVERSKKRLEALQARDEAPFMAIDTRCGLFTASFNGGQKP